MLYNGDCLEVLNNVDSVDLIITDPPYKHEKGGRGKMLLGDCLDRNEFNMKKLGDFGENEINNFLNVATTKSKQMYIFCSEKQLVHYLKWCDDNNKKYNLLTWNKPISITNRERYSTNIEYIVRIYENGCALNKLDTTMKEHCDRYSKYKYATPIRKSKTTKKHHPSEKPLKILEDFIHLSSDEGGTILDPFMGSGSTGVACKNLNRKFIGIEMDEKYFNIAKDRIENHI